MKQRVTRMAAAILAAILFFPFEAGAISAQRAILVDGQTGRVIYEKAADERSLIASTTKIMTALIVCEQCNVLDRVRIPKEAVGIEGSSMYLQEGEILTVQELLYGLMLRSGNDAAVALAIYCGGTVEGFAELMNDKARLLGMVSTHFENPNGLDSPGHYSTARDMALLACYAIKNPIFHKTVSTKTVTVGQRVLQNHNKLLWQLEGADGIKTGYTKAAGRILVSSAVRGGRRLVAVTMNAPSDWQDHKQLIEMGFSNYKVKKVIDAGMVLGTAEVIGGDRKHVKLLSASDFFFALSDQENVKVVLAKPDFVYAPVCIGQCAGTAYVCIGDAVVGKIPVIYGNDSEVEKSGDSSFWKWITGGKL